MQWTTQSRCMENKDHPNNKFQNYKKIDNPEEFCQNKHATGQFPTGTLSLQASQPTKAGDKISLSVNTIKHFLGKIGEKDALQKKSNTPSNTPMSPDVAINEVMETISMTNDNHTDKTEPVNKTVDEDDLLSLTDQYSEFISPTSD